MYQGIATDSPETARERAAATAVQSGAVREGDVQRVNYLGRTIEVAKIDHAAMGRPVDKQYERNLAQVMTRLAAIGVHAATVVSFLPIPLRTDSLVEQLRNKIIKPPKDKEPYVTYVFTNPDIVPSRMGADSPMMAFEYHPIQLAQEFSRINPKGVMSFMGIPSDIEREDWRKRISPEEQHGGRTYGQVFDDTLAAAVEAMQNWLRSGNEDDRLKRNPNEKAKAAARRLHILGFNKEMPVWVEKQRDVSVKIHYCQNCQRPCEPGAAQCTNTNCNYIIDPRKAYEINAIPESDPSLERLSRKVVKEMGISDYVAETIEEKKDRLSVGGQKPLSVVALRLLEQQDEEAARKQREMVDATAKAVAKLQKTKAKTEEQES